MTAVGGSLAVAVLASSWKSVRDDVSSIVVRNLIKDYFREDIPPTNFEFRQDDESIHFRDRGKSRGYCFLQFVSTREDTKASLEKIKVSMGADNRGIDFYSEFYDWDELQCGFAWRLNKYGQR